MRKATLSPDIPYSRPPQPSGLTKQLPPPPLNGLTFVSDSEEYDSIPPLPDRTKGLSSPRSPNPKSGAKTWGASSRSRWVPDVEAKREDVRGDSRNLLAQNENPTYHSGAARRGYESLKGISSAKRRRETSPTQSRKKETIGSSRLRNDDWSQGMFHPPVSPRKSLFSIIFCQTLTQYSTSTQIYSIS